MSPSYLVDAVEFARDCLPALLSHQPSGPVVLSGLPVDFTISLALAAWFCGRTVAFFDVDSTAIQQQSMLSKLQPCLWVTMRTPEADIPADTFLLDMASDSEGGDFEQFLSQSDDKPLPYAYRWSPDTTAVILFTSGSTGAPKGVCHSLQNMLHSGYQFQQQFAVNAADCILNLAPLHTMSGLRGSVFLPILSGCSTQLESVSGELNAILDAIDEQSISILIAGPFLLKTLAPIAERIAGLKELRIILSTGAALPRDVRRAFWKKLSEPILDYYGLTETSGLVIAESVKDYDPDGVSIGTACESVRATVINGNNEEMPHGAGLLRIYSPAIFLGYFGSPMINCAYFDTNDHVEIDDQGKVFLVGRSGRSIKSAATTWLHPEAVEKWLLTQHLVIDFAVTTEGSKIVCFVVLSSEWLNSERSSSEHYSTVLSSGLSAAFGNDYRSTLWHQVDNIQRSNLGKVNWNELNK